MGKRQPVRGQAVKWCACGEWFASERDEREHVGKCPGPRASKIDRLCTCTYDRRPGQPHMATCSRRGLPFPTRDEP